MNQQGQQDNQPAQAGAAPGPTPVTPPEVTATPVGENMTPTAPPEATATPVGENVMPTTETPLGTEANAGSVSEAPKKSGTGLIVALIAIVVLVGVGVAGWWLMTQNNNDISKNNQAEIDQPTELGELTMRGNGLSDFDLAFLKMEDNETNIIYSPLSIKYALGMLADGAEGESKAQIMDLLGDYQPRAYLNSDNRSLANAMFVRTGSKFSELMKDSYIDALKKDFNASVIYDSFKSPDVANEWVSNKTLGIIKNMFNENNLNEKEHDFVLLNALAIDMNWNNQLQCADGSSVPCINYHIRYSHEDYSESIATVYEDPGFSKALFDGKNEVPVAEVGASVNRYDIISELGEEYIRETVEKEYEKYVEENGPDDNYNIDTYMQELAENYGRINTSTDFYFYDSEDEKVFAKNLKEYDGTTLQYIGFMPKNSDLNTYVNEMTAKKAAELIGNLKNAGDINNYNEDVVTKVYADIPFFKFSYNMASLKDNLMELGITDVFSDKDADLSNMVDLSKTTDVAYIKTAMHKADIDFSNDGIKAAAATGLIGGMGAAGLFDYKWEVPVEEIDLTFDKPFFFIIRDKATGEVWFTGEVHNIGD